MFTTLCLRYQIFETSGRNVRKIRSALIRHQRASNYHSMRHCFCKTIKMTISLHRFAANDINIIVSLIHWTTTTHNTIIEPTNHRTHKQCRHRRGELIHFRIIIPAKMRFSELTHTHKRQHTLRCAKCKSVCHAEFRFQLTVPRHNNAQNLA